MKKYFISLAFLGLALFSCNSDDDMTNDKKPEVGVVVDENLTAISSKLEKLDLEKVQDRQPEPSGVGSLNINGLTSMTNLVNFCKHEESISETYEGEEYKSTIKYFDANGNKINSCDIFKDDGSTHYIIEEVGSIKTSNLTNSFVQRTEHKSSIKIFNDGASVTLNSSAKSNLTSTLNLNGEIFNILEGSNFNLTLNYSGSFEVEEYELPIKLNVLFKIGFSANDQDYHFDMVIDEKDFASVSGNITKSYVLYNSKDEKIGTIKYILNQDQDTERFEVYDLNGNKA